MDRKRGEECKLNIDGEIFFHIAWVGREGKNVDHDGEIFFHIAWIGREGKNVN